jgi:N-acetylglutamate synthase-like GNAT family acetyltransferase
MHELETLLSGSASPESFTLRSIQIGDVGKVIAQQAEGYAREFGWNVEYEGLVAQILGDFVRNFDSAKDDAWIVDRAGEIAGSIFLVKDGEPGTARLRLLYLEPWARGAKLGERLVQHCVERARDLGYRRMVLWTNDVLAAARRLYERSGFRLVEEKRHHSFGKDLTAQTWLLEL